MKLTSSNLLIMSVLVAALSGCNTYYYTPMPGASPGMPAAQAEAICKAELQREKEKATGTPIKLNWHDHVLCHHRRATIRRLIALLLGQ